jgi:6-phosphogluconolactonase
MAKLTLAKDEEQLAELTAEHLTRLIEVTIGSRGNALVCLTGGGTPRRLYMRLADPGGPWRDRIDWPQVHLFWSDERHVPPEHPDSNYGMAKAILIDRVPIPSAQVHRMRGEISDPHEGAADYEHTLQLAFAAAGRGDVTFDVMLLGLGEDAHVASIFPGSDWLADAPRGCACAGRRVAAVWAPHLHTWRITLTPAAIRDSRSIAVVVAGARKAHAVHAAIEAPLDVQRTPAQLLREAGDVVEWLLDRSAAAQLRT